MVGVRQTSSRCAVGVRSRILELTPALKLSSLDSLGFDAIDFNSGTASFAIGPNSPNDMIAFNRTSSVSCSVAFISAETTSRVATPMSPSAPATFVRTSVWGSFCKAKIKSGIALAALSLRAPILRAAKRRRRGSFEFLKLSISASNSREKARSGSLPSLRNMCRGLACPALRRECASRVGPAGPFLPTGRTRPWPQLCPSASGRLAQFPHATFLKTYLST